MQEGLQVARRLDEVATGATERPALFGPNRSLLGVVTEPRSRADSDTPAFLVLNAGLIHRAGPARLHVRLTRALATAGFLSLRLDLSGRGDSDARQETLSFAESSLADIRDAMDYLSQAYGVRSFVLMGICSGAASSLYAAERDRRIQAIVPINGYAFPTWRTAVRYYLRRARSWDAWRGMSQSSGSILGRFRPQTPATPDELRRNAPNEITGMPPVTRDGLAASLRGLLGRSMRFFFVFSGAPKRYNYTNQLRDSFPDVEFGGRVHVSYFADADHLFTRIASQTRLERELVSWATREFPVSDTPVAGSGRKPEVVGAGAAPSGRDDEGNVRAGTGRDRLSRNVLWSWAGYLVFLVSGFIVPRLIDERLGQHTLGIWDFCWSIVGYFRLAQIGVGASVNRHVAKYRAVGDVQSLNVTASSVMAIQLVATALVLFATAGAVTFANAFFASRLGAEAATAESVIVLLGMSLAVQMAFNVYNGILTGCHRWDLHNGIDGVSQLLAVALMVAVLLGGFGLTALAAITLLSTIVGEVAHAVVGHRICPELTLALRHVSREKAMEMLAFGGKLSIVGLASLALTQTNIVLVVGYLGVGALALYSRPIALVRALMAFSRKYSLVLVPTVGAMQGRGSDRELRSLLVESTRFAAYLNFPPLVFLALMGGAVLSLWMGSGYTRGANALSILALGSLMPLSMQPVTTILTGLNRHGLVAGLSVMASATGIAVSAVGLGYSGWGIEGAAAAVAAATTACCVPLPFQVSRLLGVPVRDYLVRAYRGPVLWGMALAAVLCGCRAVWGATSVRALIASAIVSALLIGPMYWVAVLPRHLRNKVLRRLGISVRIPADRSVGLAERGS